TKGQDHCPPPQPPFERDPRIHLLKHTKIPLFRNVAQQPNTGNTISFIIKRGSIHTNTASINKRHFLIPYPRRGYCHNSTGYTTLSWYPHIGGKFSRVIIHTTCQHQCFGNSGNLTRDNFFF